MKNLSPVEAQNKIFKIEHLLKDALIITYSKGFDDEYYVKVKFPTLEEAQQFGDILSKIK